MKVFVATQQRQGTRESDFYFCREGELVNKGLECDLDKNLDIDGGCGCQRGMCGFETHRGTTTFTVEDRLLSREEYADSLQRSIEEVGFSHSTWEEAWELLELAQQFEPGQILEKRGPRIQARGDNS